MFEAENGTGSIVCVLYPFASSQQISCAKLGKKDCAVDAKYIKRHN